MSSMFEKAHRVRSQTIKGLIHVFRASNIKHRASISLLFYFLLVTAHGQTRIELQAAPGFVWAHRGPVAHLAPARPLWLAASYMPARWHRAPGLERYRQARFGATLGYIHYRFSQVLGQSLAPVLFFENQPRRWWFYRISAGAAFNSHAYDLNDNPFNTALGGPISGCLQMQVGTHARLGKIYLRAGIQLTHQSNGAWRLPNLGLNIPGAFIALGLNRPTTSTPLPELAPDSTLRPYWSLNLIASASVKAADIHPAPIYIPTMLRVEAARRLNAVSAITAGLDIIHNPALPADYTVIGKPHAFPLRIGISAGHDWYLAQQIVITTQLGAYAYNPYPTVHKRLYQRYGIRLRAAKRLSYGIWLRAHLGQADCFEWAVQYRVKG